MIDATAVPAARGGVGRYVDALIEALDADGARLAIACQPRDAEPFARLAPGAEIVPRHAVVTRPSRLLWEQSGLPRLVKALGVDVVHSPHYTLPLACPAASVVTVHDATFFTDPQVHSPVKARFFRAWTRIALRRADRCVVPSQATLAELSAVVGVGGVDLDRIDVVPHGIDSGSFHPPTPEEVEGVRDRLAIGGQGYVAFLGSPEPRKNVPALIDGFVRAVAGRPDPPALVMAGSRGWDPGIEAALAAVPAQVRVIRAGYLPLESLAGFLGGAEVVVYPSLGEGFGLPVLEAMACGACVLTTRRLAMPEVGGDAVAYCGVGAGEIGAALGRLLSDPGRRDALGFAAHRRSKEFSWGSSATAHREAYQRAAWRKAAAR